MCIHNTFGSKFSFRDPLEVLQHAPDTYKITTLFLRNEVNFN